MSTKDRLDRIERRLDHLHEMIHHTTDVLHLILDAVQGDGSADLVRIKNMTKTLKASAAELMKATADNPLPK